MVFLFFSIELKNLTLSIPIESRESIVSIYVMRTPVYVNVKIWSYQSMRMPSFRSRAIEGLNFGPLRAESGTADQLLHLLTEKKSSASKEE